MNDDELKEAARLLRESGYLVAKIPPCKRDGGHGRHGLITRTAMCEGREPIPHGYHSAHQGSLAWWVTCLCGRSFNDGDGEWEAHKQEHGILETNVPILWQAKR